MDENLQQDLQQEAVTPPAPPSPKKAFSHLGLGTAVMLLVGTLAQLSAYALIEAISPQLAEHPWGSWLVSFVPLYFIGMPVGYLILRRSPAASLPRISMKLSHMLVIIPISVCMMYLGNITGTFINTLVQGLFSVPAENPVEALVSQTDVLPRIVFVVLLGPALEELVFRKFLIDRMANFGERIAVFMSALIFGLFHGNLSQLFYAFTLGLVFGYVYLRTGKLRYTVFLHAFINFIGGVLGPEMIGKLPAEILDGSMTALLSNPEALSALGTFVLYTMVLLLTGLVGFILFCVNFKKLVWKPASMEQTKGLREKSLYVNFGMIAFACLCLASIILSMF